MRYAVIENGIVTNAIEADEGFAFEGMTLVADTDASPGWTYANGVFARPADPPPRVPAKVTNFQARSVLINAGSFDQVNTAIHGSGSATAIQAWEYANDFYRTSPFIAEFGGVLGMSGEQIDALFIAAAQIGV